MTLLRNFQKFETGKFKICNLCYIFFFQLGTAPKDEFPTTSKSAGPPSSSRDAERAVVPIDLPLHPSQINPDVQTAFAHGMQVNGDYNILPFSKVTYCCMEFKLI